MPSLLSAMRCRSSRTGRRQSVAATSLGRTRAMLPTRCSTTFRWTMEARPWRFRRCCCLLRRSRCRCRIVRPHRDRSRMNEGSSSEKVASFSSPRSRPRCAAASSSQGQRETVGLRQGVQVKLPSVVLVLVDIQHHAARCPHGPRDLHLRRRANDLRLAVRVWAEHIPNSWLSHDQQESMGTK